MSSLRPIPRPTIPIGAPPADISHDEYFDRIAAAQKRFHNFGFDVLVVYADRESFADMFFLTGMDPRFEEAIYVLEGSGLGTLLLGNENFAQEPAASLGIRRRLFQALSPAGQRRDSPARLNEILSEAGVTAGAVVGVAGGKAFAAEYLDDPSHALSAPAYLVDTLRRLVGTTGDVVNGEDLFTSPEDGLRTTSSAHQIALFEYAASIASHSVLSGMQHLQPGSSELELGNRLTDHGLPHSCHTIINFGRRQGLYSASRNKAELGDAYTIAFGLRGGLTCRAGAIASGPDDLSPPARAVFPDLVTNYFDVVAAWHEALAVDQTTGSVFAAANDARDGSLFDFSLNPGHLLHYEEWSQSTFTEGNTVRLKSGSMVQCDIIPKLELTNVYVNIEDGLALADAELRTEIANDYPELWERVCLRRAYVTDVLGIELHESVMPMSGIPMWHAPYALSPHLGLVRA